MLTSDELQMNEIKNGNEKRVIYWSKLPTLHGFKHTFFRFYIYQNIFHL